MADPRDRTTTTPAEPCEPVAPTTWDVGEGDPEALERQAALGSSLRALYDEVLEEAVPESFLDLLAALERQEKDQ